METKFFKTAGMAAKTAGMAAKTAAVAIKTAVVAVMALMSTNVWAAGQPLDQDAKEAQPAKRAIMWIDGEANFSRFSHKDSIDFYLQKVHDLGFTDVAVDVRPITGEVLFNTPNAPKMRTDINAPTSIIWDISSPLPTVWASRCRQRSTASWQDITFLTEDRPTPTIPNGQQRSTRLRA